MPQNGDGGDSLSQLAGTTGINSSGDPEDQPFLMNRKFARLAGNPSGMIDREFQRLQRQSPRTPLQNTPTPIHNMIMSAARSKRGRKKF